MFRLSPKSREVCLLTIILLCYAVFFSWVAIWRHEHFLCDDSGDQLIFEQVINNTFEGKFFYNNFSKQNHFGDHNSPLLLLLVPFVSVIPAPYVLYIFTACSVAVSSVPVYLLSKEYFGKTVVAVLFMSIYLMLPAFVGQFYLSFHEINLVLPFLTFSYYFFVKERFYLFTGALFLGLLVKEDVALTLFMFAPYAVLKKRSLRWILTPALVSMSWFLFSIKGVIPFFNKNNNYGMALSYFSDLGSSISELIINTVAHPQKTMALILRPVNYTYLYLLLFPLGLVLPLLSPEIMFAMPTLFLNMLVSTQRFRFFTANIESDIIFIPRHMSLMAVVFIFIAALAALNRLKLHSSKAVVSLGVVLLCLVGYSDRFIFSKYFYADDPLISQYSPSNRSVKKIISYIPKNATVRSNVAIANHLYDRRDVYYPAEKEIDTDYVIVTNQDTTKFDPVQIGRLDSTYRMIASDNNIFLYKRL